MYTKKTNAQHLLQISLLIDLNAVADWLDGGASKIPIVEMNEWDCPAVQSYSFTLFANNGSNHDYWYHENLNKFSESLAGHQYLADIVHPDLHMPNFCKRHALEDLEWEIVRNLLCVAVNRRVIMLAPLDESVPLIRTGKTSATNNHLTSSEIVNVPSTFGDKGEPTEYFSVHKSIDGLGVIFSNKLVAVILETPSGLVAY